VDEERASPQNPPENPLPEETSPASTRGRALARGVVFLSSIKIANVEPSYSQPVV